MAQTWILSRDDDLRRRVAQLDPDRPPQWIGSCDELERALRLAPERVLVDLNIHWDRDIAECIAAVRERGAREIVAFLHEREGDIAIRAHLAGAHRVIPQTQLEDELEELLDGEG